MNVYDIRNIVFSPAFVSEIIYFFIQGSKRFNKKGIKYELVFLVLPFVMDEKVRGKLKDLKVTSTFNTAFLSGDLRDRLYLINENCPNYRKVTREGIIYLSNIEKLSIDEFMNLPDSGDRTYPSDKTIKSYLKAAYILGAIFSKEGYINIIIRSRATNI